jgi:prepilin-type N-terminal cleavage/methylation domain-containing protein
MENKGFTLIELLVVIAIIGTLSSVILSALNTARNKGNDATIKSNLANARAQADLFLDANGTTYLNVVQGAAGDVCNSAALQQGVKGINFFVFSAARAAGISSVTVDGAGGAGVAACNSASGIGPYGGWAAQVPLVSGGFYCVDFTGVATTSLSNRLFSGAVVRC